MIKAIAFMIGLPLLAQVAVVDTIRVPQGGLFSGKVEVSMPPGCSLSWNGQTYARWQSNYNVVAGAFTASLIPTDAASPSGCYYVARFIPTAAFGQAQITSYTEYWIVPTTSSTLQVKDIRATVQPTPSALVNPSQVQGPGNIGDCLIRTTTGGGVWGACSGAAAESFSYTGTISSALLTWNVSAAVHGLNEDLIAVETYDGAGEFVHPDSVRINPAGDVTITWLFPQSGSVTIRKEKQTYEASITAASTLAIPIEVHKISTVKRIVCRDGTGELFKTTPALTARSAPVGSAILSSVDVTWDFPSPASGKCYVMGE